MRSEQKMGNGSALLHCAPNNYLVPGHFLLGVLGFCKSLDPGMQELPLEEVLAKLGASFETFSFHFALSCMDDQSRCSTGAG